MAEKDTNDGPSVPERRRSDRRKLIVDVRFDGGGGTGVASTRDIGAGGMYMTTAAPLETGASITMSILIGERNLNLEGVVVYSDPGHGVGVRFKNMDAADEAYLQEYIDRS